MPEAGPSGLNPSGTPLKHHRIAIFTDDLRAWGPVIALGAVEVGKAGDGSLGVRRHFYKTWLTACLTVW